MLASADNTKDNSADGIQKIETDTFMTANVSVIQSRDLRAASLPATIEALNDKNLPAVTITTNKANSMLMRSQFFVFSS